MSINKSDVWNILDKSKYSAEGIKKMEDIYESFASILDILGHDAMRQLYENWTEHYDETFMILKHLIAST